jgi:glucose-1-phosphate adenylyltransferase
MDLLDPEKNMQLDAWQIKSNGHHNDADGKRKSEYIASSAVISNSSISGNCQIKGRVFNSIIFPGVRIGKNVDIRNSIIMKNCTIASNARISNTIVCPNVCIGNGAIIGCRNSSVKESGSPGPENDGLVLIGENILIKPREWISRNSTIYTPRQEAEEHPIDAGKARPFIGNEEPSLGMLRYGTA